MLRGFLIRQDQKFNGKLNLIKKLPLDKLILLFYNRVIMIKTLKPKTKYMNFRWNDIDYEYVIRQAKKLGISRSEYLRRLILRDRKNKALRLKTLCDRCEKEEATENLDFEDCNGVGSVYVCAKCKEKLEERV